MPTIGSRQQLNSAWGLASGTALASSTIETIISPQLAAADFVLPANFLLAGNVLEFHAKGVYSNTSTPSLTLIIRYGGVSGVALVTTGAVTTGSGVTAQPWELDARFTLRSAGATGGLYGGGKYLGLTTAVAWASVASASATVDTTAAKSLTLTGTWGTSSSSNSIQCTEFLAELLA